jgi:hypothetical protein
MTPAWGPPSIPAEGPSAAPATSVWRPAGSPSSQAGGPSASQARRVEQAGADVGDHGLSASSDATSATLVPSTSPSAVVGRVNLQDEGHVGAGAGEGGLVIGAGSVRSADVDELCARLLHHLGDAEAAADLDAFTATDHDLAIAGERS